MALSRQQKEKVVDDLKNAVKDAGSVVFVKFHGLSVGDTTDMRSKLREAGVGYTVIKKTLAKIALGDTDIQGEMPDVEGELAVAYSDDETRAAREVYNFQKQYEEAISIQGGVFDGSFISKEKMLEIAQIPGEKELRGMFVNLINSPIQRLAIVLDQVAQKQTA